MKEETRKLLGKAQRALRATETLLKAGDGESAVGHYYCAMFHTAQALLRERDLQFRKHGSVHAAFARHFAKTGILDPKFHRWLLAAFNKRIKSDYDIDPVLDEEAAKETIEQAREFLEVTRHYPEGGRNK